MPRRIIEVDGERWEVAVSGRSTQYTKDEFGLVFTRGTGPGRERRAVRYSPLGAKSRETVARPAERQGAGGPAVGLPAGLDRTRAGLPALTGPGQAPPAGSIIDLHVHSTASDGSLAPEAVVERAAAAGLGAISLTDHDTVAGVPAAVAAGERLGVRVVSGCEFSTSAPWGEMHVLGYFLPTDSAPLEAFLERCRADRMRRARAMVDRLQGDGCDARLRRRAARGPWRRGRAGRTWRERSSAAVPRSACPRRSTGISAAAARRSSRRCCPSFGEVAELVHSVRGLVSVAHLKDRGTRAFLERLKGEGLDAIETRHPSHDPDVRSRLTDIALRLGLLRTGGSDWHGDPEPGETHGCARIPGRCPWSGSSGSTGSAPTSGCGRAVTANLEDSMSATRFDFGGKVALVTGVGRAGQIGNAVALAFGHAGAKIIACDLNAVGVAERVREFAALGVDARPCAGDLTQPDIAALAVEMALRHFGRLDVVVNVAGGLTTYGPIEKLSAADFDREVAINLKTTVLVSQAAIEALSRTQGCIVNFASIAYFEPQAPMAVYSRGQGGGRRASPRASRSSCGTGRSG